jgi:hypothetical protein
VLKAQTKSIKFSVDTVVDIGKKSAVDYGYNKGSIRSSSYSFSVEHKKRMINI